MRLVSGASARASEPRHLAVAVADGERAAPACPDQQVVVAGEQDGQRERPVQAASAAAAAATGPMP